MANWYGIDGIEFIWHNEWADPEIEYKGLRWPSWTIEDALYDSYKEIKSSHEDDGGFTQYVKDNAVEYLEDCLYGLGCFDVEFIKKYAPSWFEELRDGLSYYEGFWQYTTDDEVLKYYDGTQFTVGDFINFD